MRRQFEVIQGGFAGGGEDVAHPDARTRDRRYSAAINDYVESRNPKSEEERIALAREAGEIFVYLLDPARTFVSK